MTVREAVPADAGEMDVSMLTRATLMPEFGSITYCCECPRV